MPHAEQVINIHHCLDSGCKNKLDKSRAHKVRRRCCLRVFTCVFTVHMVFGSRPVSSQAEGSRV